MKKLNNKGITMIELIITIALISVIMVFLYGLLSNITFESDNEFIDISDASIREDMIRTINDKLTEYNEAIDNNSSYTAQQKIDNKVQNVVYATSTTTTNIKIKDNLNTTVRFEIIVSDKQLTFIEDPDGSGIKQTWTLTEGTFDRESAKTACNTVGTADVNAIKLTTCSIKVYTGNINNKSITKNSSKIDNNNTLDDITFMFGTIASN